MVIEYVDADDNSNSLDTKELILEKLVSFEGRS